MTGFKKIMSFEPGEMLADKGVDIGFDDIAEMLAELPVSPVDSALGCLCAGGIPPLLACVSDGSLVPSLAAIDPGLKLKDIDAACDKLEDLAIMLLSTTRAARHEVAELIAQHPGSSPAAKVMSAKALLAVDELEEAGMLDDEEAERRIAG